MISDLQVKILHKEYDNLQNKYGDKELDSIYGAGEINSPKICFIFMNPTGRNVASNKSWKGIKAQWLGTKNIWKLFYKLDIIDNIDFNKIMSLKSVDWTEEFAQEIYLKIKSKSIYITNLAKCTQKDARALPNSVFKNYLNLLEKEIDYIKPQVVITFGNQVSSIFLNQKIIVSKCRKKCFLKNINNKSYKVYPVFYPIGQGMRNLEKASLDIKEIIKENEIKL